MPVCGLKRLDEGYISNLEVRLSVKQVRCLYGTTNSDDYLCCYILLHVQYTYI